MLITKGSTNVSVVVRIIDSTDGTPETGVVWNTAGIDMWYRREGAAVTDITEATLAALTTAHTDGGFLHIDHGNYRLDVPDAAFAGGVNGVQIGGTVTGMVVIGPYVQLTDVDLFDSVRGGMTALPNAAADAAGGLPISDAGGLDLDTFLGRITGNVALASVLGALNDAAVDGDPTATDTVMQYIKQLVNVLVGTTGVTTFPAEAAPANNVSLSEVIRAIHADVTGLNGDAMRGTDNAALASVVGALTDAAAAGDPTATDTAMQYLKQLVNVLVGTAGVTTFPAEAAPANAVSLAEVMRAIHADVTGLNGDAMRGTDNAALASVCTEARLAELDAANLPTDIAGVQSDTDDIQTRLPAALVGGRMDSDVGNIQTDAVDAGSLATDAVTEIRNALLPEPNVALSNIEFLLVAASDHVTPVTGATGISVTRSIDGGAFGAATGTVAEVGNGIYQLDASAADMNGGIITFRISATGGTPGAPDDRFITIVTGTGV